MISFIILNILDHNASGKDNQFILLLIIYILYSFFYLLDFIKLNYYIHVLLKQIMSYTNTLMCFSYSCSSQSDDVINEVKYSNKIMLPPSILQDLVDGNYETPYFFKVENTETNFGQYCGIQEFSSPPGVTHIPYHIMSGLGINEGDNIKISLVTPTDGSYIKLQPHATAFTEINDPKGLLERMLSKNYPILTEGHTITIEDKRIMYFILIL